MPDFKRKGFRKRQTEAEAYVLRMLRELRIELEEGAPWAEDDMDREIWLSWFESAVDEGSRIQEYLNYARQAIEDKKKEHGMLSRIAKLRNVTGRTPEEAAIFLKKAEILERKYRGEA